MSRHVQTTTSNAVVRGVVIPHHVIGYDPSRHAPYVALPLASPRGRLLDMALQSMLEPSLPVTEAEAVALADAFVGLVRRLMLDLPDHDTIDPLAQAGRLRLKDHIDRVLDDPDLSPERLCRIFGLSRASLYRMFAEEGGVQRYIDARRLDRCFAELHNAPASYGRIRRVAEKWGFHGAANFNRRFKSRFGIRPTDCLVAPDQATSDVEPRLVLPPVQEWMRKL
jgi:AraC-like DNA-binding protein